MSFATVGDALSAMPLVAILRGLEPDRAVETGRVLVDAGFTVIEVPLNSPHPIDSIAALAADLADRAVVGAGTVLDPDVIADLVDAQARLVVMPHGDVQVIGAARDAGLAVYPGVATPTEAFAALAAGASGLKLFPAESMPPAVVKAWRAVVPPDVPLVPVGGIAPADLAPYWAAGARGFGIGSALFKPAEADLQALRSRADAFVHAMRSVMAADGDS